jgi:rRNA processing protein Krr1/Pno1
LQIKGISRELVDLLTKMTEELSQGREVACLGYFDNQGIINEYSEPVAGGIGGIPLRKLFDTNSSISGKPLIAGVEELPDNAVIVTTKPGQTGLITDVSGIDLFDLPMVSIGVKMGRSAGISIIYPQGRLFDLSTESETIELERLTAEDIDEEKGIIERGINLNLKFLDICSELPIVDVSAKSKEKPSDSGQGIPQESAIKGIGKDLAEELVKESIKVGQGREVALIGTVDEQGVVRKAGEIVYGGIGYVPARVLASSYTEIAGKSLYEIYRNVVPENGVIVHTHPGGTGVMHMGDASAGPITWGKSIIAIGHDKDGKIKGATVIDPSVKCMSLADEYEELGQKFFEAETREEEADLRNRRFGIAQEYTNLSREIELI